MRIPKYLTIIRYGYKINIAQRWKNTKYKKYNIKYFLTESLNSQQAEMWQKQQKKILYFIIFIKINPHSINNDT